MPRRLEVLKRLVYDKARGCALLVPQKATTQPGKLHSSAARCVHITYSFGQFIVWHVHVYVQIYAYRHGVFCAGSFLPLSRVSGSWCCIFLAVVFLLPLSSPNTVCHYSIYVLDRYNCNRFDEDQAKRARDDHEVRTQGGHSQFSHSSSGVHHQHNFLGKTKFD